MKVINPTEGALEIQFRGVEYRVEAGSSIDVPADVAEYWKTMIHNFVVISDETPVAPVTVVPEVKEEVIEEVAPIEVPAIEEEVAAEEVVAAPKKNKK